MVINAQLLQIYNINIIRIILVMVKTCICMQVILILTVIHCGCDIINFKLTKALALLAIWCEKTCTFASVNLQ
jgi:hypothetical protein